MQIGVTWITGIPVQSAADLPHSVCSSHSWRGDWVVPTVVSTQTRPPQTSSKALAESEFCLSLGFYLLFLFFGHFLCKCLAFYADVDALPQSSAHQLTSLAAYKLSFLSATYLVVIVRLLLLLLLLLHFHHHGIALLGGGGGARVQGY